MNRPTDFIPFARPCLGVREEEALLRVMRSGWLTTGGEAEAFERAFAEKLGAPYALALNSATAGLHLALEALEIPEESWVITTPFTFTASAEVIRYRRAHPLFVDIDEKTLNIDPEKLEELLNTTEKPLSAFIPVHMGGLPCAMERLMPPVMRRGLKVIEDCAHAFPARRGKIPAGMWGDAGVFSFYATKTITSGEGGMVITKDGNAARRISCLRLHGIDRRVWDRFQSSKLADWEYDVTAPGYKYNLSDLAAAIGLVQLGRGEEFLTARREIAEFYLEEFQDIPGLILPPREEGHAWHLFILQLEEGVFPMGREEFMAGMAKAGIGTSVHYKPLHLMSFYASAYNLSPEDFPAAHRVFRRCVSLPIYPGMADGARERVAEAVKHLSRRGRTGGSGKFRKGGHGCS